MQTQENIFTFIYTHTYYSLQKEEITVTWETACQINATEAHVWIANLSYLLWKHQPWSKLLEIL